MQKLYGFFSRKAFNAKVGTSICETPNGDEVEVTEVRSTRHPEGSGWDDLQFVGEVTHWRREGQPHMGIMLKYMG